MISFFQINRKAVYATVLTVGFAFTALAGPYAPAAGEEGTTAIALDDPAIVGWVTAVVAYQRGEQADEPFIDPNNAIGPGAGDSLTVLSLGREGSVTLAFAKPLRDGEEFDFAVFENGFGGRNPWEAFLELAFVEVTSDGQHWVRFPSDSVTPRPPGDSWGFYNFFDASDIDGLAGKYKRGFGTPFDLAALRSLDAEVLGPLDFERITQVRLVDILGDGNTLDSTGDPIYDPWPTIGSAGFDLDGVAAMHFALAPAAEVLAVTPLPGAVELRWQGTPGESYALETAPALEGPWTEVQVITLDTEGTGERVDNLVPAAEAQFFRVTSR